VDHGYAVAVKKLGVIGIQVRIIPPGAQIPDHFEITVEPDKKVSKSEIDMVNAEKVITELEEQQETHSDYDGSEEEAFDAAFHEEDEI
jgi:small subunit ribosomal protein S3